MRVLPLIHCRTPCRVTWHLVHSHFPFRQPGELVLLSSMSLLSPPSSQAQELLQAEPAPASAPARPSCCVVQPLFTLKENCLFCSQSPAEQKDLSDSGEEPRGEAEAPHHGTGHPESAGEHALEPPAPAGASASTPPPPAPEAQLPPFPRELAGEEEKTLPLNPEGIP